MQGDSSAVHLYVRPAGVCKRDIAELYMSPFGAALGLGVPCRYHLWPPVQQGEHPRARTNCL